ncbi:MAG: O-antigen ligase family protein [Terriglobia bacterium]
MEAARVELPAQTLARWASIFLSLSVLTVLISLAASQAFLVLAAAVYAAHLIHTKSAPDFPVVKLPLTLFCLLSILSIFWAENPTVGWFAVRKLILFLIILLAFNLVTRARHLKILYQALFLESALSGIIASIQFLLHYRLEQALHPGHVYAYMTNDRASGFMGHWMNFGGQQMLVFIALIAFLLLAPRARKIWWLSGAVVATSIILNFTRGVWLGCFIACVYLVARWRPRGLWALPVLVIAGYFASPALIRKRLESVRHPSTDPSLALRFEMWQVGWRMIQQHPLVGVGPNNIPETYTLYLASGEIPEVGYREHLHNDFIQLAAERGLPCLAAWVWLMAAFGWHALRIRRELIRGSIAKHQVWLVDASFACWLAFLVEGCFEFNFGTSPVLMVFLFIASTPFIVESQSKSQAEGVKSRNGSLTADPI